MFRYLIAPAFLGAVLAMPVAAQDAQTVKSIDVTVDLTAVQNAEAAAYWKNLEIDLEGALAAVLADRISDDGLDLSVDVSEVELATPFEAAAGIDQSMLRGTIRTTKEATDTTFKTFELVVTMEQAMPMIPEGVDVTVLTPSSVEIYTALVNAYAQAVSTRISE